MMWGWRGATCTALGIAMLSASCSAPPSIALDSASAPGSPAFVVTLRGSDRPARISAFRVDACAARGGPTPESHWLTLAPDTAESPGRIRYGSPPPGWRSVQGPQPLVPGCYRAAVAGAPPLEFDVLADGMTKARRGE